LLEEKQIVYKLKITKKDNDRNELSKFSSVSEGVEGADVTQM